MTGIPTPEAVEAMTDIPPDRLDEIRDEFTGYVPGLKLGRLFGTPTVGEFQSLLSMAARALPLPRRYTGGPLEDGLYLWRREWWPKLSWASVWIDDAISRTGHAPQLMSDKFVWLIGPITIPDLPSEEASS